MARPKKEDAKGQSSAPKNSIIVLKLIKREFSPVDGKPLFKPYDCTFSTKRDYEQFLKFPNGLSIVEVVNLPSGIQEPPKELFI